MEYLQEVKDTILATLSQKGSVYWTRLYKTVKESHHKLANETFNICIKELLSNKFIGRIQVLEKGKKVDYHLTHKGKLYVRFLLERSKAEDIYGKEKERRKILLFLLLLDRRPHDLIVRSEQEFRDLLSWNRLSERDLLRKIPSVEFKDGKTITTTHFESDSGIYVWRIDTLDNRRNPPEMSSIYRYDLPGLSKTDILESHSKPAFWHINFTEDEVQGMFDSLHNENDPMFRVVAFDHNGEERYDVCDESLGELLDSCWKIHNLACFMAETIWKSVRKPTEDERKWQELLKGKEKAANMFRLFYEKRKHLKNDSLFIKKVNERIKDCNNKLNDLVLDLKRTHASVIGKYQFPCDELLEIVYPKFLQQL